MTSDKLENIIWDNAVKHIRNEKIKYRDKYDLYSMGFKDGYVCNSDYWISVKEKDASGWCNVMLCRFEDLELKSIVAPSSIRSYKEISFGMGIYDKTDCVWKVTDYDMSEWDVIAFHEIERENLEVFVTKMKEK